MKPQALNKDVGALSSGVLVMLVVARHATSES